MQIQFHKDFKKQYRTLSAKQQKQCDERLRLFAQNSFHPLLNNHALTGSFKDLRSINISGDLRAHFQNHEGEIVLFLDIDTHSNLYG